jgi:arginyl-tRNA synthetase
LVWSALTDGFAEALKRAGLWSEERLARLELAIPREPAHGDWTTNLALLIAREAGKPPRAVAEALVAAFPRDPEMFSGAEVAGPGFINFRYSDSFLSGLPSRIVADGALDAATQRGFGCFDHAHGLRIQVEYVSANPTGPLNVVNARAAAVGASLVRLLNATGHSAEGEFYVNDAGTQVDLLGESVAARFAERVGLERDFPENGYQGEYVHDLARELNEREGKAALSANGSASWFRDRALARILDWQRGDLAEYGAEFARWFRESELHGRGEVAATLEAMKARGVIYESEGAEWVRTTQFGDDKDRVVVRSNGLPTYLLPDVAYHRDKRARGFRHSIDLWGPDHHGHILPLQAALGALGIEPDFLQVLIVQQVNLLSGGQPVKMSKRAGEFITLRDLMEDIGADCAKFFFLMRSTNAHLDFDLDLARRQNDENPAYYVQYAHARIASILRFAAERGLKPAAAPGAGEPGLAHAAEQTLARKLAAFPEVVRGAALAREPHRLPAYLQETAAVFHRFYHECRVVSEDAALSIARLRLAEATRLVLKGGLALMGVTAPERMERAAETAP